MVHVRVWPREPEERGGYYCMPRVKNVPSGRKGWVKTVCPRCGEECWESPQAKAAKIQGARGLCTACALNAAVE